MSAALELAAALDRFTSALVGQQVVSAVTAARDLGSDSEVLTEMLALYRGNPDRPITAIGEAFGISRAAALVFAYRLYEVYLTDSERADFPVSFSTWPTDRPRDRGDIRPFRRIRKALDQREANGVLHADQDPATVSGRHRNPSDTAGVEDSSFEAIYERLQVLLLAQREDLTRIQQLLGHGSPPGSSVGGTSEGTGAAGPVGPAAPHTASRPGSP